MLHRTKPSDGWHEGYKREGNHRRHSSNTLHGSHSFRGPRGPHVSRGPHGLHGRYDRQAIHAPIHSRRNAHAEHDPYASEVYPTGRVNTPRFQSVLVGESGRYDSLHPDTATTRKSPDRRRLLTGAALAAGSAALVHHYWNKGTTEELLRPLSQVKEAFFPAIRPETIRDVEVKTRNIGKGWWGDRMPGFLQPEDSFQKISTPYTKTRAVAPAAFWNIWGKDKPLSDLNTVYDTENQEISHLPQTNYQKFFHNQLAVGPRGVFTALVAPAVPAVAHVYGPTAAMGTALQFAKGAVVDAGKHLPGLSKAAGSRALDAGKYVSQGALNMAHAGLQQAALGTVMNQATGVLEHLTTPATQVVSTQELQDEMARRHAQHAYDIQASSGLGMGRG